jgi:lipopolysaccharide assembly protein B
MSDLFFSWLMLALGLVLGWVLARRSGASIRAGSERQSPGAGAHWLAQLAEQDPDRAIAALIQETSVDSATADLHLTLGNLFRSRGEVDRALRIHEALLARPELSRDQQQQVRLELAEDYLKAGLIDRAESLYQSLVNEGQHTVTALEQILAIYEQGHDWQQAIEAARRLEGAKGEPLRAVIAQYYCELADEARRAKQPDLALRHAREALSEDSGCVRARLIRAQLAEEAGDPAQAALHYQQAFEQEPRLLGEILPAAQRCFTAAGDEKAFRQLLDDARSMTRSPLPLVAEARLRQAQGEDPMPLLAAGLAERPSRAILSEFLQVMEQKPDVMAAGLAAPAASLRTALEQLTRSAPRYRCEQCGFTPRQLFWQCPSCKYWSTIWPLEDSFRA